MTETVAAPPPEAIVPASPYKGLTHYTEDDASFFFGREAEIEIIVANLMASRLTLLYGESGVGKSSALRAGVLRRLREESARNLAERGEPEFLAVGFSDWRDDPIADLADAIRAEAHRLYGNGLDPVEPTPDLGALIAAWSERIDGDLILVLDQFEEYFLYHASEDGAGTFAYEFPRALNRLDLRISFLIGIREDALAKLDAFKGRIPNLFDNYLRIEHLNTKAARAAIEKPIAAYNRLRAEGTEEVAIEPELVDAVLGQVRAGQLTFGQAGRGAVDGGAAPGSREDRIETPFLQLVMTRLWDEEMAEGSHTLRLRTLERLGGAERIVRTHLDHAMTALPFEQQDVAADVFHHLVTPSGTKIAHTLSDLSEYVECPPDRLEPVLEKLSGGDVRILRPVAPPPGDVGGLRYEIFHDVLAAAISDWRLRWKQAETERELAANLEEQERERKAAEEQAARERRRARTFRAVAAIAVIVAGIAALLGVWAFRQKDTAERERRTARLQERAARAQVVVARANAELPIDPNHSLALAVAAMRMKPSAQAEQALRFAFSEARVTTVYRQHENWVNTSRWSPDGRYLLTASDDKTARVWDPRTGADVRVLRGHTGYINSAEWSADGRLVVTGGGKTARIWDWRRGEALRVLELDSTVYSVGFGGRSGEYVVTSSFDDVARVWDRESGRLLWKRPVEDLLTATMDRNGERVLTASGLPDIQARIFYWRTPERKPILVNAPDENGTHVQKDELNAAVFSPDGRYVVTGSNDKTLTVWDAFRPDETHTRLFSPKDDVLGVDMSPNGKFVAAASADGTIYIWDWTAENRLAKIVGHTDIVSDVSFSPDGRFLASASGDRTSRVWSLPALRTLVEPQPVKWASWSPDGKKVVTATSNCDEDICYGRIWDVSNPRAQPKVLHTLSGHTDWLTRASFSPDSRYAVTSADDKTARIWDADTGRQVAKLAGHENWVQSAAFSHDGRLVVTSSLDGTARIWNWRTKKTIRTITEPREEVLNTATFSPDDRYILTASNSPHDETARIWDWRRNTRTAFKVLRGHSGIVHNASWSPDGRYVVTASGDRTAQAWDWRNERSVAVLSGQVGPVKDASFSPDGRWIVTTGTEGFTRVWNWRRQQPLTQVKWHVDLAHSAQFSPDGKWILTGSDDWTAVIHPCETCGQLRDLLRAARQRVERTVPADERRRLLLQRSLPALGS